MQSNPYLFFNGECEAAFKFYEQCLGGKVLMKMTYGESPMAAETPPEMADKIMHIQFSAGDIVFMGADAPSDRFQKPQGFYVNLQFKDIAEADRVYEVLAESGTVEMPIQETFWAARWAMLTDRFGTPWMINCDLPA
jgi:PhnB protein